MNTHLGINKTSTEYHEPEIVRPALLLHSCCGPCSTAVVERLNVRFRITIYFCNSNIDDEQEYNKRLESQRRFVETWNASDHDGGPIGLVAASYTPGAFLESVRGFENEKEGGKRCKICINDRLDKTAAFAAMNGFESFTTTLSVSPHKDFGLIKELGNALAMRYRINFLAEDFKKQNGFGRSCELARVYDLYRQPYCGCRFSKNTE